MKQTEKDLREKLAELEHEQWVYWAQSILETEYIKPFRAKRWKSYFIPYADLPESVKDQDREWADAAISIFQPYATTKAVDELNRILTLAIRNDIAGPVKWELEDRIKYLRKGTDK